jgi:hypothetical protein
MTAFQKVLSAFVWYLWTLCASSGRDAECLKTGNLEGRTRKKGRRGTMCASGVPRSHHEFWIVRQPFVLGLLVCSSCSIVHLESHHQQQQHSEPTRLQGHSAGMRRDDVIHVARLRGSSSYRRRPVALQGIPVSAGTKGEATEP